MFIRSLNPFTVLLLLAAIPPLAADDRGSERDQLRFFETKVRPLLIERCFKCHGADTQKGELRVDSIESLLRGGESGAAIIPGNTESLLIEAVRYESLEMPPDGQLQPAEMETLVRWVEMGAPWPQGDAAALVKTQSRITEQDRNHWAFLPIQITTPPQVDDQGWARNEIDRFIFARLSAEGLTPSQPADREALIRRVYFDLIGLPPSPEQVDEFLADQSMDAYGKLVDRLLDSQQYGERWARHWLDLVRYAESDGYKQDAYRPSAWRYRDYVIRAFNNDKPYDQFVLEQLAGDEIAPDDPDAVVATGYLRNWIYEYNQRDVRTQWDTILDDITDVTGDVFLGMGMGCARCHDHKFDPILRDDYYRLRAFFAAVLPRDDVPVGTAEQISQYQAATRRWEDATAGVRRQLEEIERPVLQRAALPAINKFPPDIRPLMSKDAGARLPLEVQLADLVNRQVSEQTAALDMADQLKGEQKKKWESLRKQLAEFDHLKPKPLPTALSVGDVGPVAPPTVIPGDRRQRKIAPGFLTVLSPGDATIEQPIPDSNSTGRRTALARWIASPANPLSTRVIVNRVWQYHFGRGLISTASDLGRLGEPPTHPLLLDYLVNRFVESGWSIKQLHRLIVNSATYQQTALRPATELEQRKDPENLLLWRMNVHRLDAEQIRDAMLAVSGQLDPALGGASVDASSARRAIYTKVIRNERDPLLDAFDAPDNFTSTSQRNVTTTPTQALFMINGPWGLVRARAMANRLQQLNFSSDDDLVTHAFRLAYGRQPNPEQVAEGVAFLAHQQQISAPRDQPDSSLQTAELRPGDRAVELTPGKGVNRLHLANRERLPSGDFTIEAIVLLRSLYADAAVRTIAAQWDGNPQHPGWSLGVTSAKSKFQPRNLILQLVGDPARGGAGYEVIASNLHLELNKPYYVAATVNIRFQSPAGITFYLQDLSRADAGLQMASAAHKVTEKYRGEFDFTIGGRDTSNLHFWDGLIGEVRLSSSALSTDELLIGNPADAARVVGHWRFESPDTPLANASEAGGELAPHVGSETNQSPRTTALIDFCHVLLNANQFLYVD